MWMSCPRPKTLQASFPPALGPAARSSGHVSPTAKTRHCNLCNTHLQGVRSRV